MPSFKSCLKWTLWKENIDVEDTETNGHGAIQQIKDGKGKAGVARELNELSRLRAQVKSLEMQLEITKKAVAYFGSSGICC